MPDPPFPSPPDTAHAEAGHRGVHRRDLLAPEEVSVEPGRQKWGNPRTRWASSASRLECIHRGLFPSAAVSTGLCAELPCSSCFKICGRKVVVLTAKITSFTTEPLTKLGSREPSLGMPSPPAVGGCLDWRRGEQGQAVMSSAGGTR